MPDKGLRMLRHTRIFMFIAIGLYYFSYSQDPSMMMEVVLTLCTIVFAIDHFLLYDSSSSRRTLTLIFIDFIAASLVGYFYCLEGNLYLIYFNIIGVTLFFETSDKKVIRLFFASFFIVWLSILLYTGIATKRWEILGDLMNVCFVLFGCIVGYLIRKLMIARETVADQYEKLNDSHQALKDAHEQLGAYANQVEELTSIHERNRIAREIHDTVGHKMTALLIQLQLANELVNANKEEVRKVIETCETIARGALQEIRMSVQTLRADEEKSTTFQEVIQDLLQDFSSLAQIETTLKIDGDRSLISPSIQPTLTRVIQESLTNAVRHGNATQCHVHISCGEEKIRCHIRDNGKGSPSVKPGFGLVNMRERVKERGGKLRVESEPDKGFQIIAEFPLKSQSWQSGGVR